jgi:hypothetical protein
MNTTAPVRLDVLLLHNALVDLRSKLPVGRTMTGVEESLSLAAAILRHFFGEAWWNRWVMPETAKPNFLRIDEFDQTRLDLTALRVIDLAEVLYNLQHVPGFDDCIAKMRNGDIEGTYAELDLGRMLYLNQVQFRYVVPQKVKGLDYDVEVEYPDGVIACAEAKCSIESTELSANTIRNKLDRARQQLPPDRPGIVFVKMPPRWMDASEFLKTTIGVAQDFLRGTKRVVSVKFYVSPNSIEGGYLKQEHAYKEISNPNNNFGSGRNWNLFRQWDLPPEYNGMPPHWQRVLFFPDGKVR